MDTTLREKIHKLAEERERLEREEALMRDEARIELENIEGEIEKLEERRSQLLTILGFTEENSGPRAEHGQIQRMCMSALSSVSRGLTSGEVKGILEKQNPGMKLTSVAGTLSRLALNGRLRRDEHGRYNLM